ncbi:MAG: MerR family regulatory protein [Acidimicrobiales bacterium]|nr:MerR family regulatory protein [Acidimicrobiales bacterium]
MRTTTGQRISEVSARAGFSASALRFHQGAGLVEPARTPAGYRIYDERSVRNRLVHGVTDGPGGLGLAGVGIAACGACCAVPAFGLLSALVAGASVTALALGGLMAALIVTCLGVVLGTPDTAEPVPVVLQRPER